MDEAYWHSCKATGAAGADCIGVTNSQDSDADGITDGIEVHSLGTNPANADTDGDGITDDQETKGFFYNNNTWYLNPTEADSNKDGLVDALEWHRLV